MTMNDTNKSKKNNKRSRSRTSRKTQKNQIIKLPKNRRVSSLNNNYNSGTEEENSEIDSNNNDNGNQNINENSNSFEPSSTIANALPCAPVVQNKKKNGKDSKKSKSAKDGKFHFFMNDIDSLKDGKELIKLEKKQRDRSVAIKIKTDRIEELKNESMEVPTDEQINEVLSPYQLRLLGATEAEIKSENEHINGKYQYIRDLRESVTNGKVPKQYGFQKIAIESVCFCVILG